MKQEKPAEEDAREALGVTVTRKEDFSKWYLEIVRKGGFKDLLVRAVAAAAKRSRELSS